MFDMLEDRRLLAVVTAINDGPWDSAATWNGGVPGPNDRAIISRGVTVDITGNHNVDEVVVHGLLRVPENGQGAIGGSIEGPQTFAAGSTRNGIDVGDNATGTGYIMYSGGPSATQVLQRRFGIRDNASTRFIAVRFASGNWQYNQGGGNAVGWVNFTPASTDRLVASVDFSRDTVSPMNRQGGEIQGIAAGYSAGDLTFQADTWNGSFNEGEFSVQGTEFSVGSPLTFGAGTLRNGVDVADNATGTGYLMYSGGPFGSQSVQSRFGIRSGASSRFIAVRFSGGNWQYNQGGGGNASSSWQNFTPAPSDRLMASIDFSRDTITSLSRQSGMVEGIALGYSSGDLTFQADTWNGAFNEGEFFIQGTEFIVNGPEAYAAGSTRNGIDVGDRVTGTGYIMYSGGPSATQVLQRRFGIRGDASSRFITVRNSGGNWQYNRGGSNTSGGWVNFTPASTDRLVASVDFSADTVTALVGSLGRIQGIASGYTAGDLTFQADTWNGSFNEGEFYVQGTEFIVGGTNFLAGSTRSGVDVGDRVTGTGYIMYSGGPFGSQSVQNRFGIRGDASSRFIAVRNSGDNWQYNRGGSNTSGGWVNFTPAVGDRLVAAVDFSADTVTSLEGQFSRIDGIRSGYFAGDLTFQADTWNGSFNEGEFYVQGTSFIAESNGVAGDSSGGGSTTYPETRSLTADWVHVNSDGVFQIGTESNRFDTGDFTLTLTGTNPLADHVIPLANGSNLNLNNNDGFLMAAGGGRLQFFGEERLSFTKLSQTAEAGSNTIVVENIIERNFDGNTSAASDGALNWEVGDEIVVASSGFHYQEEDVRTITGIQNLGSTTRLTLNSPLTHRHYGEIETYGQNLRADSLPASDRPTSIDLRAEVALLSRNIVVKGLDSQDTDNAFGDRERLEVLTLEIPGASLEGQSGSVQGIPRGYSSGDLAYEFIAGSTSFRVTGSSFTADGTTRNLSTSSGNVVRVHSTSSGQAYLMYSAQSVLSRFGGIASGSAARNVGVVRFRGGNWEALQSSTGNWLVFTPVSTDRLLAEVELNGGNEAGKTANGIGGHIMIMNTAGQTTVDGIQMDQLGQAGRLGRYPIHWHFGGDKSGDVLRNSSITNSNNRAVVVHGTDNVLIQGVVAHDVHGHGFFLESGVERGNRFEANIALGIHRVRGTAFAVDDADRFGDSSLRFRTTAAFWITGADNEFVGNVAAGAGGTAYWIAQPEDPVNTPVGTPFEPWLTSDPYLGAMYQRDPNLEELGIFESNTGHSMVTGLVVISHGPGDFAPDNPGFFRENVDYFNDVDPVFSNTTFYKTSTALYPLVTNVTLQFPNFRSSDNEVALMDSDPMRIDGGLFVGDSRGNSQRRGGFRRANDGNRLLQLYHGYSVFEDIHIAGYANGTLFSNDIGDRHRPDANFEGVSWEDDESHGQLLESVGANRQYNQKTIYDRDGSLTSGIGGGAGWSIITSFNNWIIDTNDGDKVFNTNGSYTGLTQKRVANMQLYRRHLSSYENARWRVTNSAGQVYEMGGNADERDREILINRRPRLQLVLGQEYEVEFPRGVDFATEGVRFNLLQYSIPDGSQSVTLRFKGMANQMRPTFFETGEAVQRNSQLRFLRSATRTTYFPDPSSGDLYVKVFNRGVGVQSGYINMVPINSLQTAVGPVVNSFADTITHPPVSSSVENAFARLGLEPDETDVEINERELGGNLLAAQSGNTIFIDAAPASHGLYEDDDDSTDEAFEDMGLLTNLSIELGHDDLDSADSLDELMYGLLSKSEHHA